MATVLPPKYQNFPSPPLSPEKTKIPPHQPHPFTFAGLFQTFPSHPRSQPHTHPSRSNPHPHPPTRSNPHRRRAAMGGRPTSGDGHMRETVASTATRGTRSAARGERWAATLCERRWLLSASLRSLLSPLSPSRPCCYAFRVRVPLPRCSASRVRVSLHACSPALSVLMACSASSGRVL
jgi:hypothetical protein